MSMSSVAITSVLSVLMTKQYFLLTILSQSTNHCSSSSIVIVAIFDFKRNTWSAAVLLKLLGGGHSHDVQRSVGACRKATTTEHKAS